MSLDDDRSDAELSRALVPPGHITEVYETDNLDIIDKVLFVQLPASVVVMAMCEGCAPVPNTVGGVRMTFTSPNYPNTPTPFLLEVTAGSQLTVAAPPTITYETRTLNFHHWETVADHRSLGTSLTLSTTISGSGTIAAIYR
jgi:hypothetical protein